MMTAALPALPALGKQVRDFGTGIDGTFIALTTWHDRSAEAAILREGVNQNGEPWPVHWFPVYRLVKD